jgi:DNA-binding transcriptional LysR family regulator
LELTPAGQVYYDGCRELLDSFRQIADRVRQMQNRVAGRLRVAAIYSVGLLQMDAFVKRYCAMYPDVELRVDYAHPDDVYEAVVSDEADLGLVSFPRDGGEIASIDWQKQEMVLAVSPNHRLAGKKSVSASELNGEDYVAFTDELAIRKHLDRWFRRVGVQVNVVHEFDNIENIKRAVEIGSGVAVLPLPTLLREVDAGSLQAVSLRDVEWTRPLGIIHRRHKALTTAAERFVELLREEERGHDGSNGRASRNGRKRGTHKSNKRSALLFEDAPEVNEQ